MLPALRRTSHDDGAETVGGCQRDAVLSLHLTLRAEGVSLWRRLRTSKTVAEDRLELLAENFAVSVCGFSLMDNHLHVLVRLDPGVADGWSDEEVVRRWIAVYPPRTLDVDDLDTVRMWVEHERQDAKKVAAYRQRLQDLGWFMKSLKEPLARLANKEDDCNLLLVDYTSRVVRNGKARVSAEVAGIWSG